MTPLAIPASAFQWPALQQANLMSPGAMPDWLNTASEPGMMSPDISYSMGGLAKQTGSFAAPAAGAGFMPIANAALGGLQTIGNLWSAWQANKLAKKQFKFTRDVTNTNLANSIKSYNTQLAGMARARAFVEGQSDADRDRYIQENSLSRSGG